MKRFLLAIAALLSFTSAIRADEWNDNKFSMFIHFGVYSKLGGVWNGEPVRRGYSEQIQSHGGIQSDLYAAVAESFDPVAFDADSIVALAGRAGMRSIVLTSKHHDGFCMFNTATTDYNSVKMTPSGRDFVGELADACHRGGMNFGLYFSLIDWHCPYGQPISSHNADPVIPEHHQFNLAQVKELLTSYGTISELWFDMGSLTPEQSKELYDLVHEYQPGCMVSGRLGNDMYDFAVMPDNRYPDSTLQTPWQTCASMFNATWGYRSWQERGSAVEKADQKLRSLIQVVAHGGNYLLNIGPDDTGAVVPFERNVLENMGAWLSKNGDVIYGASASPYREDFSWGSVTCKGKELNLILCGECPEDGVISIMDPDDYRKRLKFAVTPADYATPADFKVIRHSCAKEIEPVAPAYVKLKKGIVLAERNSVRDFSYSCFDYYSNLRSTIAYNWYVEGALPKSLAVAYSQSEAGRTVLLDVDGREIAVELAGGAEIAPCRCMSAGLDTTLAVSPIRTYPFEVTVDAPVEGDYEFDLGYGTSIELCINGRDVTRHLGRYGVADNMEKIVLHLQAGENVIGLKAFNRSAKKIHVCLVPCQDPMYELTIPAGPSAGKLHKLTLKAFEPSSVHQDCMLHNLRLRL